MHTTGIRNPGRRGLRAIMEAHTTHRWTPTKRRLAELDRARMRRAARKSLPQPVVSSRPRSLVQRLVDVTRRFFRRGTPV
jgi:hypothetical protein